MHITLEADYAIRIVQCLAVSKQRMDAKTIAAATGVTLRFSLKILRKLVAAGILKSYKGTLGGYEIAKQPQEITLLEVIETIEGPVSFSRCAQPDFCCSRPKEQSCEFQRVFLDLTRDIKEKLAATTFEQLISKG